MDCVIVRIGHRNTSELPKRFRSLVGRSTAATHDWPTQSVEVIYAKRPMAAAKSIGGDYDCGDSLICGTS
jgi:hypothetical protein